MALAHRYENQTQQAKPGSPINHSFFGAPIARIRSIGEPLIGAAGFEAAGAGDSLGAGASATGTASVGFAAARILSSGEPPDAGAAAGVALAARILSSGEPPAAGAAGAAGLALAARILSSGEPTPVAGAALGAGAALAAGLASA